LGASSLTFGIGDNNVIKSAGTVTGDVAIGSVTREQASGDIQLYVRGHADGSGTQTTGSLGVNSQVRIGEDSGGDG
jgi:hypothetical protein